ncbi:MAG TPA: TGS domain-containing protein, partial [Tenuifilaceae bacterium]|nr:TGS domain-containing protein [Tenuifilaceae bacterium]
LYKKEVFAFTPTGDLKKLPHGATVLDFAFEIHSDVGCQCVGAKINGRSVPIKHTLSNGDVVEIKTSKNQKPKDEWLKIVITGKAKAKIKQKLREEKNKALLVGKEMIFRRFKNWKVDDTEKALKILQKHLKLKNSAQLFEVISSEKVNLSDLKQVVLSGKEEQPVEHVETSKPKLAEEKEVHRPDYLIIDEKLANIDFKLAKCCKPIYGDDIFGFVTIKDGIKIHRTNCPNARLLYQKYGYRIVNAKWKEAKDQTSFQTTVRITGIDELGMVNKISEVISKDLKVNMRSFTISSQNGMFEGKIQLFVSDVKSLDMLLYKLSKIKGVQRAVRIGGH